MTVDIHTTTVKSMEDYERIAKAYAKTSQKAADDYMEGAYIRRRIAIVTRDSLAERYTPVSSILNED